MQRPVRRPATPQRGATYEPAYDLPELEELEGALVIDEHALEKALQQQPTVFYDIAKLLPLMISRRDAAKQHVAEVGAEVEVDLRKSAVISESKVTVAEIEAEKLMDPRVQAAARILLDLNYAVGRVAALKEAFQQRSDALGPLVKLHLAGYYGEVNVHEPADRMKTARADIAKRRMNEERRRPRE